MLHTGPLKAVFPSIYIPLLKSAEYKKKHMIVVETHSSAGFKICFSLQQSFDHSLTVTNENDCSLLNN